jgi:preprotein translocase subunit SecE
LRLGKVYNMAVARKLRREMERSQSQKKPAAPAKKKPQSGGPAKKRTTPLQFLREVRAELKKVAWPTRTELIQSTMMVLVILLALMAIIYVMDLVFAQAATLLN